jgi:hypothetical protein
MSHSSLKTQHGIRVGLEEYHLFKIEGKQWYVKPLLLLEVLLPKQDGRRLENKLSHKLHYRPILSVDKQFATL